MWSPIGPQAHIQWSLSNVHGHLWDLEIMYRESRTMCSPGISSFLGWFTESVQMDSPVAAVYQHCCT